MNENTPFETDVACPMVSQGRSSNTTALACYEEGLDQECRHELKKLIFGLLHISHAQFSSKMLAYNLHCICMYFKMIYSSVP